MTPAKSDFNSPQCQFFVVRKKRLCRMTVRPGNSYCGEHQPQPTTEGVQDEMRIPCPNDPKHSCYARNLNKHLSICNARQQETPVYIQHNVNAPLETEPFKQPLSVTPLLEIKKVIDKVNLLYEKYLKGKIEVLPEKEIHPAVMKEWQTEGRAESSLRHLRQASRLLYVIEDEGLVDDNTCYVELGAGKGHLSYFAWQAWCAPAGRSSVLLVERAALRHKRDNKIRDDPTQIDRDESLNENEANLNHEGEVNPAIGQRAVPSGVGGGSGEGWGCGDGEGSGESGGAARRLRADLAHLVLPAVPAVRARRAVVGLAKHLCGVATDYSLRCLTAGAARRLTRGALLATCCHHRCRRNAYVAREQLLELGIDSDDFNIMLGVVSWATCGDGRGRDRRAAPREEVGAGSPPKPREEVGAGSPPKPREEVGAGSPPKPREEVGAGSPPKPREEVGAGLSRGEREEVGRRAKALLDWGRVLYLNECGFDARLAYYVPTTVSPENLCIIAKKKVQ